MKELAVLTLALFFTPLIAFSNTVQCTDRPECWPEGSAMHSGLLLVEKQKNLDSQLFKKHEELVTLVSSAATPEKVWIDERLLNAIKSQQTAWIKYRTEECELIGSLTGAGGSWPSTYANKCEVNHTELRLRRVRSAIKCIRKIPEEMRWFEQNRCLQQLAPLTNR